MNNLDHIKMREEDRQEIPPMQMELPFGDMGIDDMFLAAASLQAPTAEDLYRAAAGGDPWNAMRWYQEATARTNLVEQENRFAYLMLGLASEAGEVVGKAAKAFRGDENLAITNDIKKEVGDVMWFVSELCNYFGWTIEEVCEGNIRKLNKRMDAGTIRGSGDER